MKIVGLVGGGPSILDGEYLKEYDPNRNGRDPSGNLMLAHIVTTPDIGEAMHFSDLEELHRVWTLVDGRDPIRPDGKPNRPLTAFTVTTETVE